MDTPLPVAMFGIRSATVADDALVSALLRFSYEKLMPAAYDQALLTRLLPIIGKANPALLASGTYYLAATDSDLIIGAGGWTAEQPGSGNLLSATGHIRHFACHPDWTGQGVATALFERCLEAARASGMKRFECYASLNAVDFYRKLGFKAIDRVDIPMGGHLGQGGRQGDDLTMPAIVMERAV